MLVASEMIEDFPGWDLIEDFQAECQNWVSISVPSARIEQWTSCLLVETEYDFCPRKEERGGYGNPAINPRLRGE